MRGSADVRRAPSGLLDDGDDADDARLLEHEREDERLARVSGRCSSVRTAWGPWAVNFMVVAPGTFRRASGLPAPSTS